MIDLKRAVTLLPAYVAAMIAVDVVFKSGHLNASKPVPVWILVGFIASALAVVAVGIWYFTRRAGGKIPQKREQTYIAILVGVVVSSFAGDAVSGIAAIFLGGKSIWIMAPSYALAYVVLLWVIAFTAKVLNSRTGDVDDRSSSSR